MWRVEKVSRSEEKKNLFICRVQKTLGKFISLSSGDKKTLSKLFFVECHQRTLDKLLTAGTLTDGYARGGLLPSISILPSVFF